LLLIFLCVSHVRLSQISVGTPIGEGEDGFKLSELFSLLETRRAELFIDK
jgi:hypothetical protein